MFHIAVYLVLSLDYLDIISQTIVSRTLVFVVALSLWIMQTIHISSGRAIVEGQRVMVEMNIADVVLHHPGQVVTGLASLEPSPRMKVPTSNQIYESAKEKDCVKVQVWEEQVFFKVPCLFA